ncbi:unnamed protein product [Zymoseptoria tritici ST99CH_1A5]|uniref:Thiamine-binding protein domain-containing protein n=3 Tax=Zymoseptoria tritici TaxID=1047171 RepID=F9X7F1_ZYMTI|nr:uncharacterized protein MYCGRDRAFT_70496 [Zymoseptoria tritici IPO323]EGP89156.1 hypothetical protein MYCGRDRAFT_70496 [Zymoseptoria tritici IPO323]SMR49229.1 unnamed protein product [Zymoseptoria tritici ST99CH_1E4]SMY23092.1 unnamed protein product [Zymoseptoria tritici ST99CH_1A5]
MATNDPTQLPTPAKCTADFCLIPIGTPTASVSHEIAAVQRLLKKSGVKYSMHSAGTTLEGPWTTVMNLIGQCHSLLHANGVVRIQSDIRIGSRTDKVQGFEDKVRAVEDLLAMDGREGEGVSVKNGEVEESGDGEDDDEITYQR